MWAYSCPRCGEYYISSLLYERNSSIFEGGNFHLACIAFEWHLHHRRMPNAKFVLTDDGMLPYSPYSAFPDCRIFTPDEMLEAFPKGSDLIKRGMLNLDRMVQHPVDRIPWDRQKLPYALFTKPKQMADYIIRDLQEMEYIQRLHGTSNEDGIRIKPKGWEKIDEWKQEEKTVETNQAFVAMWFDPDMDKFYEDGIKPGIVDAGFDCTRIDTREHNNKICDEIIAEIRKSRFMVADFTGQRGGVYFEAGFAMGLGIPVIWTVHKDQIDQVHFDTRQYNHIVYESAEDLKRKLYNRIAATIH
ncbi:MAG: nucleoside 2-deoxyribosyltransferase [Phycisphaerae bacterium]|nr:nucleoside 2-deoxyribosyltransferase [Phycisphaerae bacterium]